MINVSTHSRPKAAGILIIKLMFMILKFQHTAARRRLGMLLQTNKRVVLFQHTAARRRLAIYQMKTVRITPFQHTAARRRLGNSYCLSLAANSFNTQPPEGGWIRLLS